MPCWQWRRHQSQRFEMEGVAQSGVGSNEVCALDAAEHIVSDNASKWSEWRNAVWTWLDDNLFDEAPAWLKWRILDWLSALFLLCLAKRFKRAPRVKRVLEWLLEN